MRWEDDHDYVDYTTRDRYSLDSLHIPIFIVFLDSFVSPQGVKVCMASRCIAVRPSNTRHYQPRHILISVSDLCRLGVSFLHLALSSSASERQIQHTLHLCFIHGNAVRSEWDLPSSTPNRPASPDVPHPSIYTCVSLDSDISPSESISPGIPWTTPNDHPWTVGNILLVCQQQSLCILLPVYLVS